MSARRYCAKYQHCVRLLDIQAFVSWIGETIYKLAQRSSSELISHLSCLGHVFTGHE